MRGLRAATLAAATALAVAAPLAPTSATAGGTSSISGAAALARCVTSLAEVEPTPEAEAAKAALAAARVIPDGPEDSEAADTPPITAADLAAAQPTQERPRAMRAQAQSRLASRVVIPVHAHILRGNQRNEKNVKRRAVVRWINILNTAFAGGQNSASPNTRYRFQLRSIDFTKRDAWYHAGPLSARDAQAKRALSRGPATHLNLYAGRPRVDGFPILGWARLPWQRAAGPKLDHVSVNTDAMPGGRLAGYNQGDTLVHEVGHWLGLFHTFEGGCDNEDLPVELDDTPAEAVPSERCQVGRDTCSAPGVDPIRNFMNYSLDSCMVQFTRGQVTQMDNMFMQYRLGKR